MSGKSVLAMPFIPFDKLKDLTHKFSCFLQREREYCACGCPCSIKLLPYAKLSEAANDLEVTSLIRALGDLCREVNPDAEVPPVFVFTASQSATVAATAASMNDPSQINIRDILTRTGLAVSGETPNGCCCATSGLAGCRACSASVVSEVGSGVKRKRDEAASAVAELNCPKRLKQQEITSE